MLANELVELRSKLGLKQEDLSSLLGIQGKNTVSRWEIGLRKPNEMTRRIVCLLNDLPKKEALELLAKLGQYKLKKR